MLVGASDGGGSWLLSDPSLPPPAPSRGEAGGLGAGESSVTVVVAVVGTSGSTSTGGMVSLDAALGGASGGLMGSVGEETVGVDVVG